MGMEADSDSVFVQILPLPYWGLLTESTGASYAKGGVGIGY